MAYNSDGYIMLDFTEVDFRRTNQTIEGLYKRCVDVIGTNKFILVINANGRTPLPATCSFTNNQYVIDTVIYMFAISSNDNLFIRRNDVPASYIIDDSSISVDKTWSSNKIDSELDEKQDTLTAGTNITIDENNVISSTGGAVIDDSVIVNNKVWSSLNTIEKLAPIDTIVNNPAVFNTSLELPIVECSTSFMAIQEGSGDPSPSNVRPIHGFSEVNVTANEIVHNIQLGQDVYGAEVDVVNGVAHCTHGLFVFDGTENWSLRTSGTTIYQCNKPSNMAALSADNYLLSRANIATSKSRSSVSENEYYASASLFILNIGASTLQDHIDILSTQNLKVATPLDNPFDIQLTPTQIETLIGNNTIFADTGNIKVSYRHLPIDLI